MADRFRKEFLYIAPLFDRNFMDFQTVKRYP